MSGAAPHIISARVRSGLQTAKVQFGLTLDEAANFLGTAALKGVYDPLEKGEAVLCFRAHTRPASPDEAGELAALLFICINLLPPTIGSTRTVYHSVIRGLRVAPQHRGHGLGVRMLSSAMEILFEEAQSHFLGLPCDLLPSGASGIAGLGSNTRLDPTPSPVPSSSYQGPGAPKGGNTRARRAVLELEVATGSCFRSPHSLRAYRQAGGQITVDALEKMSDERLEVLCSQEQLGNEKAYDKELGSVVVQFPQQDLRGPYLHRFGLDADEEDFLLPPLTHLDNLRKPDFNFVSHLLINRLSWYLDCAHRKGGQRVLASVNTGLHDFVVAAKPCREAEKFLEEAFTTDNSRLSLGNTTLEGYDSYHLVNAPTHNPQVSIQTDDMCHASCSQIVAHRGPLGSPRACGRSKDM